MRMARHRAGAILALGSVAFSGALLAGCSKASSDPEPPSERFGETPGALDARAVEHREALAAYRAMWDDALAAAATSDAKHPRLHAHASAGALELLRYMMRENRKKGLVAKGRLHLDPVVERSQAAKVVIRDCADATDWLRYTEGGELENDVPGGHHRVDATVRQRSGMWRVEDLYLHEAGTC
ncbi:hypothetical protein LIX60_21585 [Streptomyces sp. S07_1.15]|uniref:hypothetical protein n=1 Tax=Streptomyces sp. S07_1.15 TaxID=2873925 RepID=UPI001D15D615|nr:hypothetical protein [Streptomyces sp. S07_1.15]MCC3654008.1 hypothetical protein [Streptomyces sp. S07_1.15]